MDGTGTPVQRFVTGVRVHTLFYPFMPIGANDLVAFVLHTALRYVFGYIVTQYWHCWQFASTEIDFGDWGRGVVGLGRK